MCPFKEKKNISCGIIEFITNTRKTDVTVITIFTKCLFRTIKHCHYILIGVDRFIKHCDNWIRTFLICVLYCSFCSHFKFHYLLYIKIRNFG